MLHLFRQPANPLSRPDWAARHRTMLWVLLLQGAALLAWSLFASDALEHAVATALGVGPAAALATSPAASRRLRSCAMAIGLFSESALLVHLGHGEVALHFHFFVMLCLLAQYEDAAPFGLGVAYVVVQHGAMGTTMPMAVYGMGDEADHPWVWALVHGGFVLAAAAALVSGWRSSAKVRASDQRHRAQAEQYLRVAGTALFALDRDGIVVVANRQTCALVGMTEDEMVGADWFAVAVPAHECDRRRAKYAQVIAGPADRAEDEVDVLGPGDVVRRVVFNLALTRDEAGAVTGTLVSANDVTEQRAAETRAAREQRDLKVLRRLAQDVASMDDARQALTERVQDLADADIAVLWQPTGDGRLGIVATTMPELAGESVPLAADASGAALAFLSAEPVFIEDTAKHPAISQRLRLATGVTSALYQPVFLDAACVAVLTVGWSGSARALGSRETDLVAFAGHEVSTALQRIATRRHLEDAALTDALTGVPNRRAFDRELPLALARARRTGSPLAVAMMDLNAFKALNDREGHEAGDRLLKAVAAAWTATLRTTDALARLGGDEFVALLPDCGHDDAEIVAERLHEVVPHPAGSGVGIVVWDGVEEAEALLRRADEALYLDKGRGVMLAAAAEPDRLAAVRATGLLDVGPLAELDEISRVASWMLDVPTAAVTLIDAERAVLAGRCGIPAPVDGSPLGLPFPHTVCQHTVALGRPLLIDDMRESALVARTPAVLEDGMGAYAGIPLLSDDGHVLGALCAIDSEPRAWREEDVAVLRRLALRVQAVLAGTTQAA